MKKLVGIDASGLQGLAGIHTVLCVAIIEDYRYLDGDALRLFST